MCIILWLFVPCLLYYYLDVSVMYRSVGVVRRSANDTNILAAVGNISEGDVWPGMLIELLPCCTTLYA